MEEEVLKFWEKQEIFKKTLEKNAPHGEFVFYDGPPFATGLPHYGHILASTIKDVIPRYKTMQGYHVRRVWGWDCHGLPIENIVEGQMEISGKKQIEEKGVEQFNRTCRECVLKYATEWGRTVRRIGRWVDFEHAYKTMDTPYMESVWWGVKQIWEKGLLYEGRKVLLYCPRCETPISNFEVAMDNSYKDVTEESVYVKFKVKDPASHGLPKNTYLLAWTTTPWTLPGNVALAVGKDIEYAVAVQSREHLIFAKTFSNLVPGTEILSKTVLGTDLDGVEYEPLFEVPALAATGRKSHYVTTADFVTTDEGTGIVHTAVVYGEDDYKLGLDRDLPVVPLLDAQGHFNEEAPELIRGQYFKKAEKVIKDDLAARGLLFKKEQNTHSYPHCWRCSTPLFYNAIPAWFINIQKIKQRMLELNEDIHWYPEHLKHGRFLHGLENAPDWNISRNRYWATPIPIWKCEKDVLHMTCIGSVEELRTKAKNFDAVYGSGVRLENLDLHKPFIDEVVLSCDCGGEMRRIPEVIDCWVESASMPFAELHAPFENNELFKQRYPAQFVAEYIAQTRAWFYVSYVMSTILFDRAPFENVVTTGTILNEKGEKLSKSKKNYTDPDIILDKFGADALRFYLMSSVVMKADNLFFSDREVDEVVKKVLNLFWNCAQFYKQYQVQHSVLSKTTPSVVYVLDRWILARLDELAAVLTVALDAYDTPLSCRLIREFIDDLSTWYVRRSRERFKSDNKADKQAAMGTLRHVLLELSKLLAPFTPFIAEKLYRDLGGEKESVHLEDWPTVSSDGVSRVEVLQGMHLVRNIVTIALERRAAAKIPVRQPLAKLTVTSAGELSDELLEIIADEVNVKEVKQEPGNGQLAAELDTTLTPELISEGIAREVIRRVNDMRKQKGLTVAEQIVLSILPDPNAQILPHALSTHREMILKATHADALEVREVEGMETFDVGEALRIGLEVS